MSRKMPKAGIYELRDPSPDIVGEEYIFVTGNKKGNKYLRRNGPCDTTGWVYLLWTCVETQRELDKDYIYHAEFPKDGKLPAIPTGDERSS